LGRLAFDVRPQAPFDGGIGDWSAEHPPDSPVDITEAHRSVSGGKHLGDGALYDAVALALTRTRGHYSALVV